MARASCSSSSYLYGDAVRLPIAETAPLVGQESVRACPRSWPRRRASSTRTASASDVTILRPFNVYGPGQSDTFLVPTILKQVKAGKAIHVKDLEPRRDYVYIVDVVEAMVKAAGAHGADSGCSISVRARAIRWRSLIQTMQEVWGTDLPVRSDGVRRQGEVMDTVADIARAEQQLGWTPRFTLRQGIEDLHAAR